MRAHPRDLVCRTPRRRTEHVLELVKHDAGSLVMSVVAIAALVGCASARFERGSVIAPPPPTSASTALGYDDAVALSAAFVRTREYQRELWEVPWDGWGRALGRRRFDSSDPSRAVNLPFDSASPARLENGEVWPPSPRRERPPAKRQRGASGR